ncbi:MAG TPA: HDOD domain-containing protein [Rhodocyclaceae bacterium]|nr:HDOD domain-containing protein [Rhodocyclaceae bacterium]
MNSITSNGDSLFLGRQPILDRSQATIGYELLFRPTAAILPVGATLSAATADVVCSAYAELGVAQALGTQLAFIRVDADFLCNDLIQVLPATHVVFELDADLASSPVVLERCRDLNGAGYQFAVTGCDGVTNSLRPLLALASYAKLDVEGVDETILAGIVAQLRTTSLRLIADKVETPSSHALAERLGFDAFQGYYFARPVLVSGRKLGAATQTLVRLIKLLNDEAETHEIESVIKGEPALVANLLRLTNSVGVGAASRVTSVRQAITVLGRKQLSRWLQLLLFAHPDGSTGIRNNPLMQLAALRGHFLELLVQRCYPARPQMCDPAFIVGLLSVMPAALEMPMAEILAQISVSNDVRDALESHAGQLGQLLELVEHYDNNDIDAAGNMLANMGSRLGQQTLNLCLTEAIGWMMSLGVEE